MYAIQGHFLSFFGGRALNSITKLDIEAYKGKKRGGLADKTINNHLAMLRTFFSHMVEWGVLDPSPMATVKNLRVPQPDFDFLTSDELDRLLDAAEPGWGTFFATAAWAGLRHSELLGLSWSNVRFDVGIIKVTRSLYRGVVTPTKSYKSRDIPIYSRLQPMLEALPRRGEFVFCFEDGRPLRQSTVRSVFYKTLKRAGLRRIRVHDLRHTFASLLVMRGVPLKVVQELLGHADIEMTMRYAHLAPGIKQAAVEVFGHTGGRKMDTPLTLPLDDILQATPKLAVIQ